MLVPHSTLQGLQSWSVFPVFLILSYVAGAVCGMVSYSSPHNEINIPDG